MKKKLCAILSAAVLTLTAVPMHTAAYFGNSPLELVEQSNYKKSVDESRWDKFLKYDLCITDYNALTAEEKELCHFIFDTEQSSDETVICERARRTLAHDETVGERLTLEDLIDCYGVWDNYSPTKAGWQGFIHCIPDLKFLDGWDDYNEYWLNDTGTEKVQSIGENSSQDNMEGKFKISAEAISDISKYTAFIEKYEIQNVHIRELQNGTYDVYMSIDRKSPQPKVTYEEVDGEMKYTSDDFLNVNGDFYFLRPDKTAVFIKSQYCQPAYNENTPAITEP